MNAVVAIHSKGGEDAVPAALRMMESLRHRGDDMCGLATEQAEPKFGRELAGLKVGGRSAIGFNLRKLLGRDIPQPVMKGGMAIAFDGRIFPGNAEADVSGLSGGNPDEVTRSLMGMDSDHALVGLHNGHLFACRDPVGLRPLYWSEDGQFVALASERKALWRIGMADARSFPPGTLAHVDEGIHFEKIRELESRTIEIEDDDAVAGLDRLLMESARKRFQDLRQVCIAFSGGLDSAVTLHYAKAVGCDVKLLSVGLEGSGELDHAEKVAREMGAPIDVERKGIGDVEEAIPKVLWYIEEPDPMKVQVAVPLYWVGREAASRGLHFVAAGQGSDELYGGYRKFTETYARAGRAAVMQELFDAVVKSYEINYQRDEQVFTPSGVELRLPFTDWDLIQFSVGLPLRLKVSGPTDLLRKWILRKLGEKIGLPKSVVERKKIAVQHGTKVSAAMRKLAKRRSRTLKGYLEEQFRGLPPQAS